MDWYTGIEQQPGMLRHSLGWTNEKTPWIKRAWISRSWELCPFCLGIRCDIRTRFWRAYFCLLFVKILANPSGFAVVLPQADKNLLRQNSEGLKMCKISRRIRCRKPTGSPKIPDFWGKEEPRSVQDVPYSGRRYSGARDDALAPAKIDKPNYSEILPFTASSDIAPNA